MPSLPTITSWGQLFLVLCGIVLAIKYIYPLIRNGNGTQADFRELRSALTMLVAQGAAQQELLKSIKELLEQQTRRHS